jgi:hypothetical protein
MVSLMVLVKGFRLFVYLELSERVRKKSDSLDGVEIHQGINGNQALAESAIRIKSYFSILVVHHIHCFGVTWLMNVLPVELILH